MQNTFFGSGLFESKTEVTKSTIADTTRFQIETHVIVFQKTSGFLTEIIWKTYMRILQFSQIAFDFAVCLWITKPRESVELRDVRAYVYFLLPIYLEIIYPTSYGGGYKSATNFLSNRITIDRINLFDLVSYLILFKGIVYIGSDWAVHSIIVGNIRYHKVGLIRNGFEICYDIVK